jgi:hypothetical protein
MADQPKLARCLLEFLARGMLTGTQVQQLAKAALDDGWQPNNRLARKLAFAGQAGLRTGNVMRDIMFAAKAARLMSSGASPYLVDLPNNKGKLEVFLPHEVYFSMVGDGPVEPWCLSAEDLASDTGMGPLLRTWADHPDVRITDNLGQVAMLGMFSDGVQYTTTVRAGGTKSILVANLNVISAASPQLRARRQVLFTVQKARLCTCGCQGYCTYQTLMSVVAWSFQCLAAGVAPATRHNGEPFHRSEQRLEPGRPIPKAGLLQLRGDWENLTQMLRVRSPSSDVFCWQCDATKSEGDLCYHDFRPEANHRQTLIDHAAYMENCLASGDEPSAIFRSPGFEIHHVAVDTMHAGDLGCFQDALGSIFFMEIDNKVLHPFPLESRSCFIPETPLPYASKGVVLFGLCARGAPSPRMGMTSHRPMPAVLLAAMPQAIEACRLCTWIRLVLYLLCSKGFTPDSFPKSC